MQDNRKNPPNYESNETKMSVSSPIRTNFYDLQVEDHYEYRLHEMSEDNHGTGILESGLSRQQDRHKARKYPFSLPIKSRHGEDDHNHRMSPNRSFSKQNSKFSLANSSVLSPAKKESYIKTERNSRKEAISNLRREKIRNDQYLVDYETQYTLDDHELERDYYLEIQQEEPSIDQQDFQVKGENVGTQTHLHEKYQSELEDFLRDEQEDLNLQIQNLSI